MRENQMREDGKKLQMREIQMHPAAERFGSWWFEKILFWRTNNAKAYIWDFMDFGGKLLGESIQEGNWPFELGDP